MRGKLRGIYGAVSALKSAAQAGLAWLLALALRLWRIADAIDIPLSPLQWALSFYLVFGAFYLFATPVFEANDEIWHFGYIQHLRQHGSLPAQVFDGADTLYRQHGSQPPLYYLLAASLTSPISLDDAESYRQLNPHARLNQPEAFGNKNLVMRAEGQSLLRGTGLAVLLLRGLGLGLGAATVALIYKIGELVAPQRTTVAFVAAAITALNPMFIFVTASVSNDSLAMALNGLVVLLLLRTLRDGFRLRIGLALALAFGLACLTKVASLALLPALLGVCFFVQRKRKDRRGCLIFLCSVAIAWLVIAGWWHLRNLQLYGEPLGIVMMADIAGPRGMTFGLVDLFAEFQQFRMSYWGLFGALNIQLASIFYVLLDLMSFLSAVGLAFLILQLFAISDFAYARYELAHLLTLLGALLPGALGILALGTLTQVAEGRMLFPLMAVASPLLAVGLVEIVWWIVFSLRPPNLEFVRAGDAVPKELLHDTMLWQLRALGLVALLAPLTVIGWQYGAPGPVSAIPPNAREVYAEYGDIALVAYERVDRRYAPGDNVRLKLYWQVLEQSSEDKSLLLSLVDDNRQAIGQYASYPGAGSLRTSAWQAGAIYPDEYLIKIQPSAYGRYPFDLHVAWAALGSDASVKPTDAEGAVIEPVLLDIGAVVSLRFQAAASEANEIPIDSQPAFDEAIILESYRLDLELNELTLHWKAETAPGEDFTIFAHLLDDNGEILTQADSAPRLPTSYWRWGEAYTTFHRFPAAHSMLDGEVIVGLYINDGLSYPRAEYQRSLTAQELEGTESAPPAEPESADETAAISETDVYLDSFTIPIGAAREVLALTPTPEASAEGEPEA